jgi:putative chitinase
MLISRDQLRACMPHATKQNIDAFIDPLNEACEIYNIKSPERIAMFLAQLAHESGELRYTTELASGAAYDVGKLAVALGNTPQDDGDGERYKGRGLIQITGLGNYKKLSAELKTDFVSTPSFLCMPKWASLSAGWYWNDRNLNFFADKQDIKTVTKKINGGYNGLTQRTAYWITARRAFGLPEITTVSKS